MSQASAKRKYRKVASLRVHKAEFLLVVQKLTAHHALQESCSPMMLPKTTKDTILKMTFRATLDTDPDVITEYLFESKVFPSSFVSHTSKTYKRPVKNHHLTNEK
eukprot:994819-Amphidinium_carterae.1